MIKTLSQMSELVCTVTGVTRYVQHSGVLTEIMKSVKDGDTRSGIGRTVNAASHSQKPKPETLSYLSKEHHSISNTIAIPFPANELLSFHQSFRLS